MFLSPHDPTKSSRDPLHLHTPTRSFKQQVWTTKCSTESSRADKTRLFKAALHQIHAVSGGASAESEEGPEQIKRCWRGMGGRGAERNHMTRPTEDSESGTREEFRISQYSTCSLRSLATFSPLQAGCRHCKRNFHPKGRCKRSPAKTTADPPRKTRSYFYQLQPPPPPPREYLPIFLLYTLPPPSSPASSLPVAMELAVDDITADEVCARSLACLRVCACVCTLEQEFAD